MRRTKKFCVSSKDLLYKSLILGRASLPPILPPVFKKCIIDKMLCVPVGQVIFLVIVEYLHFSVLGDLVKSEVYHPQRKVKQELYRYVVLFSKRYYMHGYELLV